MEMLPQLEEADASGNGQIYVVAQPAMVAEVEARHIHGLCKLHSFPIMPVALSSNTLNSVALSSRLYFQ
jgi:hypothetical protein